MMELNLAFILILNLIFVHTAISKTGSSSKPTVEKPSKDETDQYMAAIKQQDVTKQISQSAAFTKHFQTCKDLAEDKTKDIKDYDDCIQKNMASIDDEAIETLSKDMDLKSFDRKATKNAGTLRDYLTKRINESIHGKSSGDKNKPAGSRDQKFVDQALYAKLYRSQIGKNVLLDISTYCLESFGSNASPNTIVSHCMYQGKPSAPFDTETGKPVFDYTGCPDKSADPSKNLYSVKIDDPLLPAAEQKYVADSTSESSPAKFWRDHAREYIACTGGSCKDLAGNADTDKRDYKILEKMKEVEFAAKGIYLQNKYIFCAQTVIKNMCEVYRCKNVYTTDPNSKIQQDYCKKIGITVTRDPVLATYTKGHGDYKPAGVKACGLVAKLKEYRKVLLALDETDKQFDDMAVTKASGFKASVAYKGVYNYGKGSGEKSVEQITSISSDELSKASNLEGAVTDSEDLRKECFDDTGVLDRDNDKCKGLISSDLDEDEAKKISQEMIAETAIYMKRIEKLKENPKELEDYLNKHGLSDYVDKIGDYSPEQLVQLISDKYKSEREALKQNMMDKFNKISETGLTDSEFEDKEKKLASDNLDEMEMKKNRIETLYQYNNVISSYLQTEDKKSKKIVGDTSLNREIELAGMREFSDDDNKVEEYEDYFNTSDDATSNGGAGESSGIDADFINGLISTE